MAKGNKNKNFVLRIDVKMMEAIEQWAEDEFRSVNGQILYLLEQALKKNGRNVKKNQGQDKKSSPP
jgi:hypothetical protein